MHIHKSNAVIFEWLNSPIVYHSDHEFIKDIKHIQSDFFSPQAAYHHYQGMAKKAGSGLDLNQPIQLKKWCYLIRALMASLWIKEYQTIPPVDIHQMFVLLSDSDSDEVSQIIALKQDCTENHLYQLNQNVF